MNYLDRTVDDDSSNPRDLILSESIREPKAFTCDGCEKPTNFLIQVGLTRGDIVSVCSTSCIAHAIAGRRRS